MTSPNVTLQAIKAIKSLFYGNDGTILWSCYGNDATIKSPV